MAAWLRYNRRSARNGERDAKSAAVPPSRSLIVGAILATAGDDADMGRRHAEDCVIESGGGLLPTPQQHGPRSGEMNLQTSTLKFDETRSINLTDIF
jgi:hypothetical protein